MIFLICREYEALTCEEIIEVDIHHSEVANIFDVSESLNMLPSKALQAEKVYGEETALEDSLNIQQLDIVDDREAIAAKTPTPDDYARQDIQIPALGSDSLQAKTPTPDVQKICQDTETINDQEVKAAGLEKNEHSTPISTEVQDVIPEDFAQWPEEFKSQKEPSKFQNLDTKTLHDQKDLSKKIKTSGSQNPFETEQEDRDFKQTSSNPFETEEEINFELQVAEAIVKTADEIDSLASSLTCKQRKLKEESEKVQESGGLNDNLQTDQESIVSAHSLEKAKSQKALVVELLPVQPTDSKLIRMIKEGYTGNSSENNKSSENQQSLTAIEDNKRDIIVKDLVNIGNKNENQVIDLKASCQVCGSAENCKCNLSVMDISLQKHNQAEEE